jgi:hypothetical protein
MLPNESAQQSALKRWIATERRWKKKHVSRWLSVLDGKAMTQSQDEVRTDLIDRTERLEGHWKEVIIAGGVSVLLFLVFGHRFSC